MKDVEDNIMKEKWLVHMCILLLCSVEDTKRKSIALWKICTYGIFAVGMFIGEIYFQSANIYDRLITAGAGSIPGIILFIISKVSAQSIGYGDCWMIMIMGASVGIWNTLGILAQAFLGIFLWAALIFIRKKGSRSQELPFLPFLAMGMAGAYTWMV